MLTRLKVSGFKNLIDVDVRFGAFTCIAGANGVGKSNLFDAIRFLSVLAEGATFVEAAQRIRDEKSQKSDVRSLFHRSGTTHDDRMTLEAEMLIPPVGKDDWGQSAKAGITFLQYKIELRYSDDPAEKDQSRLELWSEDLKHITRGEAVKHLLFPNEKSWRQSVVSGRRTTPYISTLPGTDQSDDTDSGRPGERPRTIELHQDGQQGRPRPLVADSLPRTALASINTREFPTILLARNEMRSWRLLQLEPSAMRSSDEFTAANQLGFDGSHMPATLYRLAKPNGNGGGFSNVCASVANRLADLIRDARDLTIERDEKRELLTLMMSDRAGTSFPARALSDGTLRFLALAILEHDPATKGVICLEEPENGIHPERIPAMLTLLKAISVDTAIPVDEENPLRQVIVNTHSPSVVQLIDAQDLLMMSDREIDRDGRKCKTIDFRCLEGTWRADTGVRTDILNRLISFLKPVPDEESDEDHAIKSRRTRRVADHPQIEHLFSAFE